MSVYGVGGLVFDHLDTITWPLKQNFVSARPTCFINGAKLEAQKERTVSDKLDEQVYLVSNCATVSLCITRSSELKRVVNAYEMNNDLKQ